MLGKPIVMILAVVTIVATAWWSGFQNGKSASREAHLLTLIEVSRKAEEAAQKRAQTLAEIKETVMLADQEIETIRKGLFDENAAPGDCPIRADWVRKLDQIR